MRSHRNFGELNTPNAPKTNEKKASWSPTTQR